jgi:hypothetical protein
VGPKRGRDGSYGCRFGIGFEVGFDGKSLLFAKMRHSNTYVCRWVYVSFPLSFLFQRTFVFNVTHYRPGWGTFQIRLKGDSTKAIRVLGIVHDECLAGL